MVKWRTTQLLKSALAHVVNAIGDLQAYADIGWQNATDVFPVIEELQDIQQGLMAMIEGGDDVGSE